MKVLSNDSMRLNRLQKHLVLKTKEFFSSKAESFKWMRLYKSESYQVYRSISNLHLKVLL
nr:unnamed protein product [Callosobruchus analis]